MEGYDSFQIAFQNCSAKSLNKPSLGHLRSCLSKDSHSSEDSVECLFHKKFLREIRGLSEEDLAVGSSLNLKSFAVGKRLKITGVTKGKGFSGVIKKYHFSRGRMSHGAGYPHRQIGSLCFGRGSGQKVIKGKKMPGQMGNKKVTKLARIERVDVEREIIFIRGSVPGPQNGLLILRQVILD